MVSEGREGGGSAGKRAEGAEEGRRIRGSGREGEGGGVSGAKRK